MGEVPIIAKLGEDGLVQTQCADHPGGRQFKHLPHRLSQYIVPILSTAVGIDVHGDWISFADGIALQNGVDVKTVSSMLGHYDAGFTLRTYTHATRQKQDEAAQTMGSFMAQVM